MRKKTEKCIEKKNNQKKKHTPPNYLDEKLLPFEGEFSNFGPGKGVDFSEVLVDDDS